MKRIEYIDSLKGMGIILVVLGHHLHGMDVLVKWINSFHMPMFFAISGFLFSEGYNQTSFFAFFKRKAKGLMYPYFTLSLCVMLWHFVWYGLIFKNSIPENTTRQVFFLTVSTYGYHALWFIPCLFCALMLFRLLIKLNYGRVWLVLLVIVALLFESCVGGWPHYIMSYIYRYLFRVIIATSFLWLGYEFKRFLSKSNKAQENVLLIVSIIVSAIFLALTVMFPKQFVFVNLANANIGNPIVFYITSISNSIIFFALAKKIIGISRNFFAFWGKNSIIVLALHMDIAIEFAWVLVNKANLSVGITINSIFAILLEMLFLFGMIIVINKWFKWIIIWPFGNKYIEKNNTANANKGLRIQ